MNRQPTKFFFICRRIDRSYRVFLQIYSNLNRSDQGFINPWSRIYKSLVKHERYKLRVANGRNALLKCHHVEWLAIKKMILLILDKERKKCHWLICTGYRSNRDYSSKTATGCVKKLVRVDMVREMLDPFTLGFFLL